MSNEHKYKKYKYKYTQTKMNMRGGGTHMRGGATQLLSFALGIEHKFIKIDHRDSNYVTFEEIVDKVRSEYKLGDKPIRIIIHNAVLDEHIIINNGALNDRIIINDRVCNDKDKILATHLVQSGRIQVIKLEYKNVGFIDINGKQKTIPIVYSNPDSVTLEEILLPVREVYKIPPTDSISLIIQGGVKIIDTINIKKIEHDAVTVIINPPVVEKRVSIQVNQQKLGPQYIYITVPSNATYVTLKQILPHVRKVYNIPPGDNIKVIFSGKEIEDGEQINIHELRQNNGIDIIMPVYVKIYNTAHGNTLYIDMNASEFAIGALKQKISTDETLTGLEFKIIGLVDNTVLIYNDNNVIRYNGETYYIILEDTPQDNMLNNLRKIMTEFAQNITQYKFDIYDKNTQKLIRSIFHYNAKIKVSTLLEYSRLPAGVKLYKGEGEIELSPQEKVQNTDKIYIQM
jgi:hypothetical protein